MAGFTLSAHRNRCGFCLPRCHSPLPMMMMCICPPCKVFVRTHHLHYFLFSSSPCLAPASPTAHAPYRDGLCGWGNHEQQTYTMDNHRVENGVLFITVRVFFSHISNVLVNYGLTRCERGRDWLFVGVEGASPLTTDGFVFLEGWVACCPVSAVCRVSVGCRCRLGLLRQTRREKNISFQGDQHTQPASS